MGPNRAVNTDVAAARLSKPERDRLVEAHIPLVVSVARRYAGRGAELEDLVQVGAVALVTASERFDPQRGTSFGSFASPTVEGAIRHHLRKVADADQTTVAQSDQPPATDEIPDGLSALAGSDDRMMLRGWLRTLSDRDRQIVYLRYHADMTERDIAREVGLSQAQVSRRLADALVQLRAASASTKQGSDPAPPVAAEPTPTPAEPASVPADPTPAPAEPAPTPPSPTASSEPSTATAAGASAATPPGSHSGRFLVRMDGELHERLSDAAKSQHLSLNRFVTQRLAESLTPRGRETSDEQQPLGGHLRTVLVTNIVVVVIAAVIAIVLLVLALERGL